MLSSDPNPHLLDGMFAFDDDALLPPNLPGPEDNSHQSSGGHASMANSTLGTSSMPAPAALHQTTLESAAVALVEQHRRRVGRPRTAKTTTGAVATAEDPSAQPKRGRGPKPKYVFTSQEAAADARKERNRKAALESYYRWGHGPCVPL